MDANTKITVYNISPYRVFISRKMTQGKDYDVKSGGKVLLSADEITAHVESGDVLFCGTDSAGSHARLYIDNPDMRREFGFDTDERKQLVVTKEKLKEIFAVKSEAEFKRSLGEAIRLQFEIKQLQQFIANNGTNKFNYVKIAESMFHIAI